MCKHRAVLLARITMLDGFSNRSQLDVRRGENHELVLELGYESLSNLHSSRSQPPPAFCLLNDDPGTVDRVVEWLGTTNRRVTNTERGPSAVKVLSP